MDGVKGHLPTDLVSQLKDANARGVSPPQNWTHRAIEEIEFLRARVSGLVCQFDHQGCSCSMPSENCCSYAAALSYLDKVRT